VNVKRAREICEAATSGPWRCDGLHEYDDGSPFGVDFIESASGEQIVVADSGVYPPHGPDATFIAESRALLPEALDEIDRLRALLVEACDLAAEGWAYAGDYFRDKWRVDERLSTLRSTGTGETK
jgi:hypothetical protein